MGTVQTEKQLSALSKLECEVCVGDIRAYYNLSADLVELNDRLLALTAASPRGAKSLSPGRVVVLRDGVSEWVAAWVICFADTSFRISLDR